MGMAQLVVAAVLVEGRAKSEVGRASPTELAIGVRCGAA